MIPFLSIALMALLALAACTAEMPNERSVTPQPQGRPWPGLEVYQKEQPTVEGYVPGAGFVGIAASRAE